MKIIENEYCRRIVEIHPHDAFHTKKDLPNLLFKKCMIEKTRLAGYLDGDWLTGDIKIEGDTANYYFYGVRVEIRGPNGRKS